MAEDKYSGISKYQRCPAITQRCLYNKNIIQNAAVQKQSIINQSIAKWAESKIINIILAILITLSQHLMN
jgi:hypothetical protein